MSYPFATGIILAAGKGTRMKSDLPKCAHPLAGLSMVQHVGAALKEAGVTYPVCVVGHKADQLIELLDTSYYRIAYQKEQLGTGHAVMMTKEFLKEHQGPIIVVPGDAPLIESNVIQNLLELHNRRNNTLTIATCTLKNPYGYGRVIRDEKGTPCEIVEEKDADEATRQITEVSTSIYCFSGESLFELLEKINNKNAQLEYYLTDALKIAYEKRLKVGAIKFMDSSMLYGVNDRYQLSQASRILYDRILKKHALNGVSIVDPNTTYIDQEVVIGVDATIHPMTTLSGKTIVGEQAQIGPFTKIEDCTIGARTEIIMSYLNKADIKEDCRIGPFANIRPHTVIHAQAKIGNFVEIKNSHLHQGVTVSHLAYIGDANVGKKTNIGAGAITCNYDGFSKYHTDIGAHCFIGSNSTLIAPLTIGEGAFVAAGSVISKNVLSDALAIGRGKQENKEEWAKKWREKKNKPAP